MSSPSSASKRPLIGGISAVLLVMGGLAMLSPGLFGSSSTAISAACIRTGSIMGAIWLAYPDLYRIPQWMWVGLLVACAVIAIRPRAALVVLPLLLIIWMVIPKQPKKPKQSKSGISKNAKPDAKR